MWTSFCLLFPHFLFIYLLILYSEMSSSNWYQFLSRQGNCHVLNFFTMVLTCGQGNCCVICFFMVVLTCRAPCHTKICCNGIYFIFLFSMNMSVFSVCWSSHLWSLVCYKNSFCRCFCSGSRIDLTSARLQVSSNYFSLNEVDLI